jgi:rSAM/selenodomain-associated transferase 1
MMTALYGIMIKYPEPGKVKTRLAKDMGNERAAHIYRQTAELILANTVPANFSYDRIVFYDPPERLKDFTAWLPGEQLALQQGADVGERMDNAIRDLLKMGAKKAVITGADIPDLSDEIIETAFRKLDQVDIVIGPAKDGGYYLIGMKSRHPAIFQDIPWSTGKVLEETMRIIEKLQLKCALITTLSDLDTADDYKRLLL